LRALAKTLEVLKGALAGSEFTVLALQDAGDGTPPLLRVDNTPLLLFPPTPGYRVPRIKSLDLVKVVKKIVKEAGGVGDAREWKTHWFHGWALYHLHDAIGLMPCPQDAKIAGYFQLVRTAGSAAVCSIS
jgi:hypothetical protein